MISRTPHHACDLTGYRVLVGAAICFLMIGIVALTGSDDRTSKTHRVLAWGDTWRYLKEKALGRTKPEFKLMKNAQVGKLLKTAQDHTRLKTEHTHNVDGFQDFQKANKLMKQALQKEIDRLTSKLKVAEKLLKTANTRWTDARAQLRDEKRKTTQEKKITARLTQQLAGHEKTISDLPDRHADCVLYQLLQTKIVKSVVARDSRNGVGGESLPEMKARIAESHGDGNCICSRVAKLCEVAKQDILLRAHAITGKNKLEKYFWS